MTSTVSSFAKLELKKNANLFLKFTIAVLSVDLWQILNSVVLENTLTFHGFRHSLLPSAATYRLLEVT